jgi:hypothetical protein
MRLRLDYYDHNERFAKLLPVDGTIARWLRSKDGGEWVLFQLDAPTIYEGVFYPYFLLRSRWRHMGLGGKEPTSVFILLVTDQQKAQDGFDVHSLPHVAWGITQVLE